MADCPSISGCPFFNDRMANMPATADIIKNQYCKGEFEKCARFTVSKALGKENVPSDLYPAQLDKAVSLIKK